MGTELLNNNGSGATMRTSVHPSILPAALLAVLSLLGGCERASAAFAPPTLQKSSGSLFMLDNDDAGAAGGFEIEHDATWVSPDEVTRQEQLDKLKRYYAALILFGPKRGASGGADDHSRPNSSPPAMWRQSGVTVVAATINGIALAERVLSFPDPVTGRLFRPPRFASSM